jgi:hypothetical protein
MSKRGARIHSDLQTVGDMLKTDLRYKVPQYQRNFSWTMDEVEQLWQDINEAINENRPEYFLGTIVVEEDAEEKTRMVIDGQQRLATLTMILAAVRTIYSEFGDDRANEVYSTYLGNKDRRTRVVEPRLTLNEANEPFFRQMIVEDCPDETIQKELQSKGGNTSDKILGKSALYLREQVRKICRAATRHEDYLLSLEEFISDRVVIISVLVGDEADAYLIFETLNDRGLDLSTSDLLKNYIFGKVGKSNLELVRQQWREMVFQLGSDEQTQFLRHYWLSRYGVIRERDLFKELRKKFPNANSVLNLMKDLVSASDKYSAIASIDHSFWAGYSTESQKNLEALQLFNISQFKPLLLAAMETCDQPTVEKIIRVILVVSMRYSIIGSLGTGNIEKAYSDSAINVRNGTSNSAAKVFGNLKSIYLNDADFEQIFAKKTITKAKLARFVLASIANHVHEGSTHVVNMDEKFTTLEHIMPKNRNENWTGATPDEATHMEYVWRLGNLTLLERDLNRDVGSKAFEAKKIAFAKSHIETTCNLTKYPQWTMSDIETRQAELAKLAVEVWASPY